MAKVGKSIVEQSKIEEVPIRLVGQADVGQSRVGRPGWTYEAQILGGEQEWSLTHDSFSVTVRADDAQLRRINDFLGSEGEYDKLVFSEGTFNSLDRSGGDSQVVLDPPSEATPLLPDGETWFVEKSDESQTDQDGKYQNVTLEFTRLEHRDFDRDRNDDYLWEERNTGEWLFEFTEQDERIATRKVEGDVSGSGKKGVDDQSLNLDLELPRLRAFIECVSKVDAVDVREVPDGNTVVEDNHPHGENKVKVIPPSGGEEILEEGTYAVEEWTAKWIHNTEYVIEVKLSETSATDLIVGSGDNTTAG